MKLKVILQHSSARKSNRYTPYKEWASPRLDYWSARVDKHASVPQLDNTLKYWTLHSGNVDQKGRLTLLPRRIDLSTPEETLGLSLQNDKQVSQSVTAAEEVSFPRNEKDSESEQETRLEDEFLLKSKGISTSGSEKKDYEAKHGLDNKSEHQTRLEEELLIKSKDRSTSDSEKKECEVDFRHESVRQKIDYTRPRPKSPREKPGFCARHRPYVRITQNHREALAYAERLDLSRVQFIDNF